MQDIPTFLFPLVYSTGKLICALKKMQLLHLKGKRLSNADTE